MRKQVIGSMAALGMLVLILDSRSAVFGAREGITLCLEVVIPSLFPFFLLSGVINRAFHGCFIPGLGRLFRMSPGTEPLLIPALLGGYPVGAQSVGELYHRGQLSREEGTRLLTFCSNAGPAFLFGMVRNVFSSSGAIWLCWGIQILSMLCAAQFGAPGASSVKSQETRLSAGTILRNALSTMAQVCGWVVAFRVLLTVLNRWLLWVLPVWARVLVTGLLELTNGCCELTAIASENLRFILCNLFLAFGGVCVLLQTGSVIYDLPLRAYFTGKLVQAGTAFILSLIIVHRSWWVLPLLLLGIFSRRLLKKSGNPVPAVV